jgi:hypothetical protein
MNILKNMSVVGLFGMLAVGSVAPAQANPLLDSLLPQLSSVTARAGEQIAAELKVQLARAIKAPRVTHPIRRASVTITEPNTVVVVATRLPPLDVLAEASEAKVTNVRF